MKRLFYFLTLFTAYSLISSASPPKVSAQLQNTQNWICLNAGRCDRKESGCIVPSDREKYEAVHRMKLTLPEGTTIPTSSMNFIAECFTEEGSRKQVCTTGSIIADSGLNPDPVAIRDVTGEHNFEGLFGADGLTSPTTKGDPTKAEAVATDASGNLPDIYWQDTTQKSVTRRFFIIRSIVPSEFTEGKEGGQQQATFSTVNTINSCSSVSYDPYGFVFDSKSLEPIPFVDDNNVPLPGSEVKLYLKGNTEQYAVASFPLVQNPQYPKSDGLFNFVVPDGTYKLDVKRSGYTFPADKAMINSNYSRVYSDLYPMSSGVDNGYGIVQIGQIQHRDIPLDPIDGIGKEYPVKLLKYFYFRQNEYLGNVIIEGWASHPFVKVKAYSIASTEIDPDNANPVTMLSEVKADKLGHFKIEVDQTIIRANEKFGTLIIEKTKLTNPVTSMLNTIVNKISALFSGDVLAQETITTSDSTKVGFNPLPAYIEAIAKDSTGKIIPNAKVNVIISGNTVPYYSTTADATGYYKITSEYIPMMAYSVEYVTTGGKKIAVDTSTLVAENATGSAKPSYTYRDASGQGVMISPTTAPVDTNPVISDVPSQVPDQQVQSPVSYFLIIVIVILLLLGISGVILGIYLLKKKEA